MITFREGDALLECSLFTPDWASSERMIITPPHREVAPQGYDSWAQEQGRDEVVLVSDALISA